MTNAAVAALARRWVVLAAWLLAGFAGQAALAQGSGTPVTVLTHHYDNFRSGWNSSETRLTATNVNSTSFGLLEDVALDDEVDGQPLVDTWPSGKVVVYVTTSNDTVYAIDANTGAVLQKANFGTPVQQTMLPGKCNSNGPNVGIDSTPVIHGQSLYVMTYTVENGAPVYRLHQLDVQTLKDQIPGGVVVTASHQLTDGTTYAFNAAVSRQRPALLYANGNIYAGFGSWCDFDGALVRGWLLGWKVGPGHKLTPLPSNQLNNALATEPTPDFRVSMWMSGAGVAADAKGDLYFVSANAGKGATYDPPYSVQESAVRMSADLSKILGIFTPADVADLDNKDLDFGGGGILLIEDTSLPQPFLATAAGKDGNLYLLNRTAMNGLAPNPAIMLQSTPIGGCFCSETYFKGADGKSRVVTSGGKNILVWQLVSSSGKTSLTQESKSVPIQTTLPGFFTTVSSNGTVAGSAVIWAVTSLSQTSVTLYALDAASGAVIYTATAGPWTHTTSNHSNEIPVVANGRVFVGSYQQLAIFGLGGTQPPSVKVSANAAPDTDAPGARVSGTIASITGTHFVLNTRTGSRQVDATQAETTQHSVDLYPGRAVFVRGTIDQAGVLHAGAVYQTSAFPAGWVPDRK